MNTIALVGNPNSGKTTLFNALTGSNQHVGNWPGVTVEKKVGKIKYKEKEYSIVDLPGAYSLGAYSEDEMVARDFILKENPDIVINVIDATNIERNLYLTTQLLEMGANVILALNMMDEALAKDIEIDLDALSKSLGLPIVATVASKRKGINDLIKKAIESIDNRQTSQVKPTYGPEIDKALEDLEGLLSGLNLEYPREWLAIKILEGDLDISNYLENLGQEDLGEKLREIKDSSPDYELDIVDRRYNFIKEVLSDSLSKPEEYKDNLTDKIDRVITHKYLGLPIFGLIMFIIFQLTFAIGEDIFGEFVADAIEALGELLLVSLDKINAPQLLSSFLAEGIFGGVAAVFEFVPLILVLYFFIGILEDTGYMARAAYVMDGLMRSLGLHGKSFISMIVGFGCNVPGIMATRTLDSKKDRMIAMLINPFMSCGAKLPIYLVFIAAFFPNHGGIVLFILYALGIFMALLLGKIFSRTLFKGESSDFIMELPPYRLPSWRSVLRDMWDKVWDFIHRAGTAILIVISLLWILSRLPFGVEPYSQGSILGKIGALTAPIFAPAGFGTWEASVSLFAGIAAKEVVIATLGMVYAGVSEGAELVMAIQNAFTPLTASAFMVLILFYTPCVAALATFKKETNSYKWPIFMALYTFFIGWLAAVLVYQIGTLIGF